MAEKLVCNYLTLAGIEVVQNSNKETKSEHDLECKLGTKRIKIEVKFDWMSCKTNNIAIEYQNTKTQQPSGLMISKSDIWAIVVKDNEHYVIFTVSTEKLKEYVKNHKGRTFLGAGDGNADLWLYPASEILSIFKRIDNVSTEEIPKILKGLLK